MRSYFLVCIFSMLFLASCSGFNRKSESELVENGFTAMSNGDYSTAEHLLNQALKMNDKNPYALLNLGVVYQETQRYEEARELYQSVIDLNPSLTAAVTNVEGHAGKSLAEIARFNLNNLSPSTKMAENSDKDADGVLDGLDQCDDTPALANVNFNGCWTLMGIFAFGKAEISSDAYGQLENVITVLRQNPSLRIEVQGHTDNTGSAAANKRLSEKRAKSVMQYLIEQGIRSERVQFAGYGPSQPIASNSTATGRKQNRRVELKPLP